MHLQLILSRNLLSTGINYGGIAAILNLAMSRGRASTNQTFFAGERKNTVPIMRTREGLFFFLLKRLDTILSLARPPDDLKSLFHSPYSFCKVKLVSEDNFWHFTYPLRDSCHIRPTQSLSTSPHRTPPGSLWSSSSSVSFWCPSLCCVAVAVLVLY